LSGALDRGEDAEELITNGDRVVSCLVMTGTGATTRRPANPTRINVVRIADGRIVESLAEGMAPGIAAVVASVEANKDVRHRCFEAVNCNLALPDEVIGSTCQAACRRSATHLGSIVLSRRV
jgi:hypothetical protein